MSEGWLFEWKLYIDPATGKPVQVRYTYLGDGRIIHINAFNTDGTPFTGDLSTLIPATSDVAGTVISEQGTSPWVIDGPVQIQDSNGDPILASSGALNVNIAGGGGGPVTQGTIPWEVDGSAHPQPVTGTFWQGTQPVSGTFWQATQPVSQSGTWFTNIRDSTGGDINALAGSGKLAVALSDGTGAVIDATGNSLNVNVTGGSGIAATVDQGTSPWVVSASSLPLPTGAATESTLGGVLTTTAFQARINIQGQKAMAASTPVVIASDQSTLPVSVASLPLPTGAATETTLAALNTKTPALGQTTMSGSRPVAIASDQTSIPVTSATLATAALQTTGNTQLTTISTSVLNLRPGTAGAFSAVSVSTSTTALAALDATRLAVVVCNTDAALTLYVAYGFNASTTNFSEIVTPLGSLEVPTACCRLVINGAASSGTLTANVTKVT